MHLSRSPLSDRHHSQYFLDVSMRKEMNRRWGDGSVVKFLSCKHEDQSSTPRTHMKRMGVGACTCHPQHRGGRKKQTLWLTSQHSTTERSVS